MNYNTKCCAESGIKITSFVLSKDFVMDRTADPPESVPGVVSEERQPATEQNKWKMIVSIQNSVCQ